MGFWGKAEGENRGAARFGKAETRRRSLRQPPQAAGAAPRAALPQPSPPVSFSQWFYYTTNRRGGVNKP